MHNRKKNNVYGMCVHDLKQLIISFMHNICEKQHVDGMCSSKELLWDVKDDIYIPR